MVDSKRYDVIAVQYGDRITLCDGETQAREVIVIDDITVPKIPKDPFGVDARDAIRREFLGKSVSVMWAERRGAYRHGHVKRIKDDKLLAGVLLRRGLATLRSGPLSRAVQDTLRAAEREGIDARLGLHNPDHRPDDNIRHVRPFPDKPFVAASSLGAHFEGRVLAGSLEAISGGKGGPLIFDVALTTHQQVHVAIAGLAAPPASQLEKALFTLERSLLHRTHHFALERYDNAQRRFVANLLEPGAPRTPSPSLPHGFRVKDVVLRLLRGGLTTVDPATAVLAAAPHELWDAEASARRAKAGVWAEPGDLAERPVLGPFAATVCGVPSLDTVRLHRIVRQPSAPMSPMATGTPLDEAVAPFPCDPQAAAADGELDTITVQLPFVESAHGDVRREALDADVEVLTFPVRWMESRVRARALLLGQNVVVDPVTFRDGVVVARVHAADDASPRGPDIAETMCVENICRPCALAVDDALEVLPPAEYTAATLDEPLDPEAVEQTVLRVGSPQSAVLAPFLAALMADGQSVLATVEAIHNGTSYEVLIPSLGIQIPFALAGVLAPEAAVFPPLQHFLDTMILHREVEILVTSRDPRGVVGAMRVAKASLGETLAAQGFAAVVGVLRELPAGRPREYWAAQNGAREQQLGLWAPGAEAAFDSIVAQRALVTGIDRVSVEPMRPVELLSVLPSGELWVRYVDLLGPLVEACRDVARTPLLALSGPDETTVLVAVHPEEIRIPAGMATPEAGKEGQRPVVWCRGKASPTDDPTTATVRFVDFGVEIVVPRTCLFAPTSANDQPQDTARVLQMPPQSFNCCVAYIDWAAGPHPACAEALSLCAGRTMLAAYRYSTADGRPHFHFTPLTAGRPLATELLMTLGDVVHAATDAADFSALFEEAMLVLDPPPLSEEPLPEVLSADREPAVERKGTIPRPKSQGGRGYKGRSKKAPRE